VERAVVEEQSDDEVVGESDDEDILEDARSYLITQQITRELDMGDYTRAY
jgi:CMP-N-acetylneuraminic acid synthetase